MNEKKKERKREKKTRTGQTTFLYSFLFPIIILFLSTANLSNTIHKQPGPANRIVTVLIVLDIIIILFFVAIAATQPHTHIISFGYISRMFAACVRCTVLAHERCNSRDKDSQNDQIYRILDQTSIWDREKICWVCETKPERKKRREKKSSAENNPETRLEQFSRFVSSRGIECNTSCRSGKRQTLLPPESFNNIEYPIGRIMYRSESQFGS